MFPPTRRVMIHKEWSCRFEETSQGLHSYLILRPEQKLRVLEAWSSFQPASSCVEQTTAMNMKPLKSNYSAEPAS